jgi:hypothetical protein
MAQKIRRAKNALHHAAQLDFLIFLSEKRGRAAELFKLVNADGNA